MMLESLLPSWLSFAFYVHSLLLQTPDLVYQKIFHVRMTASVV
jgi:hypothetical protein